MEHESVLNHETGGELPVWKTVYPQGEDSYELTREMRVQGVTVHREAEAMIYDSITLHEGYEPVDLVCVDFADLGLCSRHSLGDQSDPAFWEYYDDPSHREEAHGCPTTAQINKAAGERGLAPCPPEVVPRLRLEYVNQPEGERLFVGMEPIPVSPKKFEVRLPFRNEQSTSISEDIKTRAHWRA